MLSVICLSKSEQPIHGGLRTLLSASSLAMTNKNKYIHTTHATEVQIYTHTLTHCGAFRSGKSLSLSSRERVWKLSERAAPLSHCEPHIPSSCNPLQSNHPEPPSHTHVNARVCRPWVPSFGEKAREGCARNYSTRQRMFPLIKLIIKTCLSRHALMARTVFACACSSPPAIKLSWSLLGARAQKESRGKLINELKMSAI